MRIFKGKYLVVSLVIHLAVISSFLLFQKSIEEAETFMLVTEIIQIKGLIMAIILMKESYNDMNMPIILMQDY